MVSAQIFGERIIILIVLFVHGTCCEFVTKSGRTLQIPDPKFGFW